MTYKAIAAADSGAEHCSPKRYCVELSVPPLFDADSSQQRDLDATVLSDSAALDLEHANVGCSTYSEVAESTTVSAIVAGILLDQSVCWVAGRAMRTDLSRDA